MQALDTIATILLFIVLIGWVCLSIYAGAMSVTLSDSGAPGVAVIGVLLAVFGIPLSVMVAYVIAVVRAWHADGYTFYYPLVAFVVGTAAAALVLGVAWAILWLGLRIHGTDEERRRDGDGGQPRDPGRSAEAEIRREASDVEVTPTAAPPRLLAFERTHELRDGSLWVELGVERETGRRYLRTPMPQRNGEWNEYYGINLREYETFIGDTAEAHRFADECRRQEHFDRWMSWPGSAAPTPIARDRTRLAKKRATLLTDHPTDSSGVPVEGIPVGTAFVRIVGSGVDPDGNVRARLLGEEAAVVAIDAGQLGL